MNKQADVKISKVFRVLGLILSSGVVMMLLFYYIYDMNISLAILIQTMFLLIIFGPVCALGYIPGKFLDRLPSALADAIKLDIFNAKV